MKNFLKEFKEFAIRGNVADLAIGIIIGGAFTGIVNSLVKDIIMPPIGLLLNHVDFSSMFIDLSGEHYATLAEAQKAGAATINYGTFLNLLISFAITAFVVFMLVKQMNRLRRRHDAGQEVPPTTKMCPFCFTSVSIKATRCPACTSQIS